ncbi:PREDICTED: uncharacterized protein LOC105453818 isoform X1 [Wasmannia auropunctata]|uniref:uncharacterized protein LOC105453818 isoform X1 n=1 Tax=Wasmannia auropunctata TaxID=64793 RepID=UPI0005ED68DA|nr:PREDICTED: uncharacterized protein LOC105453818 isoform X1 [Wasmannia auropunctata]
MPKLPIRKAKRVGVLATKRTQCLKNVHFKERSYRPLYEKLKHNNNYLAKALSQEKQTNQTLFSQNVDLIGEIQQLNHICNTRNTVISNVLNNSKEILKMLVTMTGYMTNTISMCQELVASDTAARISSASAGMKESPSKLTKPPAKGVVKPMVSGHTITKPTINLSRVNMESFNIARLSDIPEVTPNRSQEMNETRSPIIPTSPLRYENGRTCRLPERLTLSSPRFNAAEEQRLRRKRRSHHSKRLSVSFSRSQNRWSGESPTSAEHINVIGTRIDIESQESHDDTSHDLSDRINAIAESQVSIDSSEEDEPRVNTSKKDLSVRLSKISSKDFSSNSSVAKNSRLTQNSTRNWEEEDPLEGPSWRFNNPLPRDNEPEELDHDDVSDVNNNMSQVVVYDESSVAGSSLEESLNESVSNAQTSERDATLTADGTEFESGLREHDSMDGTICEILSASNRERNTVENSVEDGNVDAGTMKFASFVTLRRGQSEAPEEPEEDFTLMLRPSAQNMQFNMNELRLPVLEKIAVNNSADSNETDAEVTAAIPRVTNVSKVASSASNRNSNESDYDHIMQKLPLIIINNHQSTPTQQKTKHSSKSGSKKTKIPNMKDSTSHAGGSSIVKSKAKFTSKSENNRDPSAAKVVLEKLNESHVKPRTSANDTQNASNVRDVTSDEEDNVRDSENSTYASNRPRRRKAPVNLKEPKLNKKLRRQ